MEITKNRIVHFYILLCPITKSIKYVGKSVNIKSRYSQHTSIKSLQSKKPSKVINWLLKLLNSGNKPLMYVIDKCFESDKWQEKEKYWIKFYKEKYDLCNLTIGGEGLSGRKLSASHKNALRMAHIGKAKNYKTAFPKGSTRGPMSKLQKNKISTSKTGMPSKRKIRVALFDGNVKISEFESLTSAATATNTKITSINNNLMGRSKQTKIGTWKKI